MGAQVINLLGSTSSGSSSGASTTGMPDMPYGPAHPWYNFHNQRNAIPPGAPRPNLRDSEDNSPASSGTVYSDYIPSDEERRRARQNPRHRGSSFHQGSYPSNQRSQHSKEHKSKPKHSSNKRKRYSEDPRPDTPRQGGGRGGRRGGGGPHSSMRT